MKLLGNILWFIFAGLWQGIAWVLAGVLWCITIVGIPVGVQAFKISKLCFFPFGKKVVNQGGAMSCLLNVLWIIFGGLPLAIAACINGAILCLTIIGIPFGLQCFKFAGLALAPFGARIVKE